MKIRWCDLWVNQVRKMVKHASRQIRVWWILQFSSNDGTQHKDISNLISNKTRASHYMIRLFGKSWCFKVWKWKFVESSLSESYFVKPKGPFDKVMDKSNTNTHTHNIQKQIFKPLFLKENILKMFWSHSSWIRNCHNSFEQIIKLFNLLAFILSRLV